MTAVSRWSLSCLYVLKSTWTSQHGACGGCKNSTDFFEELLLMVLKLAHHTFGMEMILMLADLCSGV
jgi:hypothetical protein